MNILQVVEPGRDGVFRHVEDLIEFLSQHNHTVSLAYSDVRSCDRLPKLVESVRQRGGAVLNLHVGNEPALADIGALEKLARFVQKGKFQVMHAHSSKAGGLIRPLTLLWRKPKVYYTPHAYFAMDGRRGVKPLIFNTVERLLASLATTVNVSEDEAAFARESLGVAASRQVVIPNPVNTEHFQPGSAEQKAAVRAALGIPANALVIGAIGRLSYQKNPQMLYEAFAVAAKKRPDALLFHLGEGHLQREVNAICAERNLGNSVLQKHYLPDTRQFYQAVDMLVMTSRFEGLSYAVLEALSSNLPLILTDVPGNRDFFSLGLSHIESCPTQDAAACAAKMEAMCSRIAKGEPVNHREIALRRFSLSTCFNQLLNCYEGATPAGVR